MAPRVPLWCTIMQLWKEDGRQCAIEITSISLTGAHLALQLFQKIRRMGGRRGWEGVRGGGFCFPCTEATQTLGTKTQLAADDESAWPLAFMGLIFRFGALKKKKKKATVPELRAEIAGVESVYNGALNSPPRCDLIWSNLSIWLPWWCLIPHGGNLHCLWASHFPNINCMIKNSFRL